MLTNQDKAILQSWQKRNIFGCRDWLLIIPLVCCWLLRVGGFFAVGIISYWYIALVGALVFTIFLAPVVVYSKYALWITTIMFLAGAMGIITDPISNPGASIIFDLIITLLLGFITAVLAARRIKEYAKSRR